MKEIISLFYSFSSITIHNYAFIEQIWLNAMLIGSAGCVDWWLLSNGDDAEGNGNDCLQLSRFVINEVERCFAVLNMDRRLSYHKIYVFLIFSAFEHFPTSTAR